MKSMAISPSMTMPSLWRTLAHISDQHSFSCSLTIASCISLLLRGMSTGMLDAICTPRNPLIIFIPFLIMVMVTKNGGHCQPLCGATNHMHNPPWYHIWGSHVKFLRGSQEVDFSQHIHILTSLNTLRFHPNNPLYIISHIY